MKSLFPSIIYMDNDINFDSYYDAKIIFASYFDLNIRFFHFIMWL